VSINDKLLIEVGDLFASPEFLPILDRVMSENFFLWYPTLVDPPKSPERY
jgi:hypothetical protein